jgi:hypothetical protein
MKIYRPKLCECGCGEIVIRRFVRGHHRPNKGRIWPKELNARKSETMRGHVFSKERNKKISDTTKGVCKTEEHRKHMCEAAQASLIVKERMKKLHKSNTGNEKRNKNISKAMKGKPNYKLRERWRDPEFAMMMAKASFNGNQGKPTKPELFLMQVLNQLYPNEWKYTGDFSFMIGGKNPDFVNVNGQKKCIEHYGDYWHKGDDPQDRINLFKSYGWDCLVIWENELKDFKSLRRKIFDFAEGKVHGQKNSRQDF